MRSYALIIFVVLVALVSIVYLGGAYDVGGKRPFEHLDQALGTTFFMGCYYKLVFLLMRDETSKQDEWTKGPENWDKVLKNTVE
jgi:hypothetical protein